MKKILFALLILGFSPAFAQKTTYQLSSHILDVSKGMPAPGVTIQLEKFNPGSKDLSLIHI